jgi:hypothetical protein
MSLLFAWLAAVAFAVAVDGYKVLLLSVRHPGQVVGGPVITWAAAYGVAGGVLLAGWAGIAGLRGQAPEGKAQVFRIQAVTLLAGALAGAVWLIPNTAPRVNVAPGPAMSLTVLPGTVVQLTNSSGTVRQVLCVGAGTRCQAAPGAPRQLAAPGLVVPPGQTANVQFPAVGRFHLTSTVTPHVAVTVVVRQGPGYDGPNGCTLPNDC